MLWTARAQIRTAGPRDAPRPTPPRPRRPSAPPCLAGAPSTCRSALRSRARTPPPGPRLPARSPAPRPAPSSGPVRPSRARPPGSGPPAPPPPRPPRMGRAGAAGSPRAAERASSMASCSSRAASVANHSSQLLVTASRPRPASALRRSPSRAGSGSGNPPDHAIARSGSGSGRFRGTPSRDEPSPPGRAHVRYAGIADLAVGLRGADSGGLAGARGFGYRHEDTSP